MLTPAFELFQDDVFLTIVIKAPFTKISETEIFIEENDFKFFSNPYFLRLNLPGNIVEDGRETASYDSDKGTFTIKVPKETAGQYFEGLDMLTKLLTPKGRTTAKQPCIEVLGADKESLCPRDVLREAETEIDWYMDQKPYREEINNIDGPQYGFASFRSGVFKRLQSELCEVVDIRNPDSLTIEDRKLQRIQQEETKFDDDHYLADLYHDEFLQDLLQFKPSWHESWEKMKKGANVDNVVHFTPEEREKMRKLPNKDYLIEDSVLPSVYQSLVDIVFAYAFNQRIFEGETSVESGWTICKLSSTFSWLEVFSNLKDVVVSCFRRSLCFPLYRHWMLTNAVLQDARKLFQLGRCQLLKCLLDVHTILQETDQHYILNDLYITDYCVWIQTASEYKLESLAAALNKIEISKADIGFNLMELETAARITVVEEEENMEKIAKNVSKLSLGCSVESSGNARDSDDDSGDSDDESTLTDEDSTETDDGSTDIDDEISASKKEDEKIIDKNIVSSADQAIDKDSEPEIGQESTKFDMENGQNFQGGERN